MARMRKVTVSFSDEEGQKIKDEAKKKNMSISGLLRKRLEKFIKKRLVSPD